MAKQPFPTCPLSPAMREGSPDCRWTALKVLERSATKTRTQYQCDFCGDIRHKVDKA
ncbi:hypothetical protein [Deinococcus kurensis]|uniref:hypothetical protein n=1 Tax=Deinococcus kurensis TaxID=2662757 RepID=UPI0012D2A8A7|nr:hypothetical protein [Deinococcus kurensis]